MIQPVGIKLRRTARWNLQTVSLALNGLPARAVARPGPCGNPWTVAAAREAGYSADDRQLAQWCVDLFREWATGNRNSITRLLVDGEARLARLLKILPELRGHNLACHCELDMPCHRNVLLELANA